MNIFRTGAYGRVLPEGHGARLGDEARLRRFQLPGTPPFDSWGQAPMTGHAAGWRKPVTVLQRLCEAMLERVALSYSNAPRFVASLFAG